MARIGSETCSVLSPTRLRMAVVTYATMATWAWQRCRRGRVDVGVGVTGKIEYLTQHKQKILDAMWPLVLLSCLSPGLVWRRWGRGDVRVAWRRRRCHRCHGVTAMTSPSSLPHSEGKRDFFLQCSRAPKTGSNRADPGLDGGVALGVPSLVSSSSSWWP